jgi:hypothetical protein
MAGVIAQEHQEISCRPEPAPGHPVTAQLLISLVRRLREAHASNAEANPCARRGDRPGIRPGRPGTLHARFRQGFDPKHRAAILPAAAPSPWPGCLA